MKFEALNDKDRPPLPKPKLSVLLKVLLTVSMKCPFGHGVCSIFSMLLWNAYGIQQDTILHDSITHVSNLDFRFLHCLYHKSVVLGQVEEASAFPGRGKLPEGSIPTYSQHVISRIHLKQLPQMSEDSKKKKVNNKAPTQLEHAKPLHTTASQKKPTSISPQLSLLQHFSILKHVSLKNENTGYT